MREPRPRVVCPSCGWDTGRVRRDDGTYGTCRPCGAPLVLGHARVDHQIAKAHADLRHFPQNGATTR